MRLAGAVVHHLFRVAVIRGDQHHAAGGVDCLVQASEAGVDGFDGLDRGAEIAGMADHVGVGVIDQDEVEAAAADRLDKPVGDFEGGHFRLQVVGGHFRRGNEDALFARKDRFVAAVEEERDMRVFLGLGDAQLREAGDSARTSPSTWRSGCGGNSTPMNRLSASEYSTMPSALAKVTVRSRAKPSKAGSSSAVRISRARSARKFAISSPSPSRMPL